MIILVYSFWVALAILCYTYIFYPLGLYLWTKFVRPTRKDAQVTAEHFPTISLLIPAYNELETLAEKVRNSKDLDYPKEKLEICFVTDGSDDGSELYLEKIDGIKVFHKSERQGKIAAMNRMKDLVQSEIIVFSDANAMLNQEALLEIVQAFSDPKVGCVAGEKRVASREKAGQGEGIYWKYESGIKQRTSNLYSAIGAAGELFAIRKELYKIPPGDTILDDFILSLEVLREGYRIAYCPNAYALEEGSKNLREELKRKIRIAAGGVQAISRTLDLLNPLKYPIFSFHYFSHRVLRWSLTPFLLPIILLMNIGLAAQLGGVYSLLLLGQLSFYLFAYLGWRLSKPHPLTLVACYFTMMHWAVILGWRRYLLKSQSVLWERSKRA